MDWSKLKNRKFLTALGVVIALIAGALGIALPEQVVNLWNMFIESLPSPEDAGVIGGALWLLYTR